MSTEMETEGGVDFVHIDGVKYSGGGSAGCWMMAQSERCAPIKSIDQIVTKKLSQSKISASQEHL